MKLKILILGLFLTPYCMIKAQKSDSLYFSKPQIQQCVDLLGLNCDSLNIHKTRLLDPLDSKSPVTDFRTDYRVEDGLELNSRYDSIYLNVNDSGSICAFVIPLKSYQIALQNCATLFGPADQTMRIGIPGSQTTVNYWNFGTASLALFDYAYSKVLVIFLTNQKCFFNIPKF
jgi:hypothetical protein